MAFTSVISGASSSLIRRATRAFWAARNFRAAVSNVAAVENQSLTHEIPRGGSFLHLSRLPTSAAGSAIKRADEDFLTAGAAIKRADEDFLTVLDTELGISEEREGTHVPDWFPFEIEEDVAGRRAIFLKGKYENETIKVECRDVRRNTEDDYDMDSEEEADTKESFEDFEDPVNMPMVVTISKGVDLELEFRITAFAKRITIDSVSLKNLSCSEEQLPYEGPALIDMGNLVRRGFYKYLDARGINDRTAALLLAYMADKDDGEYRTWLNNLKKFVGVSNSQVTTSGDSKIWLNNLKKFVGVSNSQVSTSGDSKIWLNNLKKFFSGDYKIYLKNLQKFVA